MIKVDRDMVGLAPLAMKQLKAAHAEAKAFYAVDPKDRSQKRFAFKSEAWRSARPPLLQLFDETCAYCESPSSQVELNVEHFRPVTEATNPDGSSVPDCYWWLAYKWENLYLVCTECAQNKSNLFPVDGDRLKKERMFGPKNPELYLLIDPCLDQPTNYLRFLDDGVVQSISMKGAKSPVDSRGSVAIQVLGLNRADLVARRRQAIERVRNRIAEFNPNKRNQSVEELRAFVQTMEELTSEFTSFVAAKRHHVARFFLSHPSLHERLLGKFKTAMLRIDKNLRLYVEVEQSFTGARARIVKPKTKKVVTPATSEVSFNYDNVYIKRIEISNFRNIHSLDLNLQTELSNPEETLGVDPAGSGGSAIRTGWKMLLGENGAGKSSVLKAVALALMGEEDYKANKQENRLEESRIFNRNTTKKSGFIKITLSKGEPIEVRLTRTKVTFVSGAEGLKGIFIRGYGSARLLDRPENINRQGENNPDPLRQVTNLFHPEDVLSHPIGWLNANTDALDSAGLSFRDLLNLPDDIDTPLTLDQNEIMLNTGGKPVPLTEQSDGYKTVLAFVLDMLAGLPTSLHDKSTASGIILIDELDSHLHPKWKMRIVKSLRKAFPKLQFIATTHEPLCLRGLGKGEISVMRKVNGIVEIDDDLPSPENLRIDQLLTSELFGLESTIDPVVDEKFFNYYQLLANSTESSSSLPPEERQTKLAGLKHELQKYNTLGFTRRDQMVYDLIDEYLANKTGKTPEATQSALREETKKRVFELWDLINLRNQ